jgi:two-component system response regulator HydG
MPKLLLIEDDNTFNNMLSHFLTRNQYVVQQAFSTKEALDILNTNTFEIILSDLRLPDGDGITLLSEIRAKGIQAPFVLMTAYADVKTAVNAMKKSAADYIAKPFVPEEVLLVLQKVTTQPQKKTTVHVQPKGKDEAESSFFWGESNAALQLKKYIDLIAPTPLTVLITGESGTGKEVTSKSIHEKSSRKEGPFIAVDCGAIPKDIAASEFFGHIKGSFTGAIQDKTGCFEAATGGTLFLDEIGNLPYELQILLLRAIQERKIKRIGSTKEIEVDVRIISATNENLKEAVANGTFREDLYHRLNEFSIETPSLRNRKEDIEGFARIFMEKASEQLQKSVNQISTQALLALQQYAWPGNIRELQNVMKRCVLLCQSNCIDINDLPSEFHTFESISPTHSSLNLKEEAERKAILDALSLAKGNKSRAAEILGMARKTLYNKISYFDIEA